MADLDEVSAMIGGLRADVKRVLEWTDRHEVADQLRFENLATKISQLEVVDAEARGGWKMASIVGGITGALGAFAYHIFPFFK